RNRAEFCRCASECGQSAGTSTSNQLFKGAMHQCGRRPNARDATRFIEQGVIEVECRPHIYQYASLMRSCGKNRTVPRFSQERRKFGTVPILQTALLKRLQ